MPTDTVLEDAGSCSSSCISLSSRDASAPPAPERKLGNRRWEPRVLSASTLGRLRCLLPESNGASSSFILPLEFRFVPSNPVSSFSRPCKSSASVSLSLPKSPYPLFRLPDRNPPIRRFLRGICPPLLPSRVFRSLRADDGVVVVTGSSSWMSRSRSESESSGESGASG